MVFDSSKQFEVHIVSGGVKKCLLRWPTDEEWARLIRAQKVVTETVGDSSKTRRVGMEKAHLALFEAIRQDGDGESFDAFEATEAISKLQYAERRSVLVNGKQMTVTLGICRLKSRAVFEVSHTLNIPDMKQITEFQRANLDPSRKGAQVIITTKLEPAGALYDQLAPKTAGYSNGSVPLIHKEAVIAEIIEQADRLLEDDDPEV